MYIGDPLARRALYTPQSLALVDGSVEDLPRRFTYAQLNQRANGVAAGLRAHGITHGSRVALIAHDSIVFYDVFFGCGKLGAALVALNWRLHPRELEEQVRLTEPALVLFEEAGAPGSAVAHLEAMDSAPTCITLGEVESMARAHTVQPVSCDALTERDTACLLFTGGTTGRPKAAQMSHGQIAWNTFNTRLGDVRETDIFLNIFPMYHAGGLFAFSVPLLILGGTVVQMKRFDAAEVLRIIAHERVTIFGGVPTMFQMLADSPAWPSADLSSLRFCMSGGAPMPIPLIKRYQSEKGVVFRQGFGMTEFGPGVFSLPAEDAERKAGSIGRPNFFVDARIVDLERGQPVPTGERGELVLRGPSAMTGYFRDPVATAAAFDAQGWFHTGDLAYVDEDGCFYIVDRIKDMYISGGENVYPGEVEAVLYEHAVVAQCAVVGVPDEKWGQVGRAFVVLRPGANASERELIEHTAARIARYKVPHSVVFCDSLPVSAAGKVLRRELRDA
jgi:fatty-acyl-CoA synthase